MLLHLATLSFVAVLIGTHIPEPWVTRLRTPLSLLRDGTYPSLGYALFGLLVVIHLLLVRAAWGARNVGALTAFCLATVLSVYVATTPSMDGGHLFAAVLALSVPYTYYAVKLKLDGSGWLFPHLFAPLMLMVLAMVLDPGGGKSVEVTLSDGVVRVPPYYGLWQKGIVLYFLLIANVHRLALPAVEPAAEIPAPKASHRRRRVYALDSDQGWQRRQQVG